MERKQRAQVLGLLVLLFLFPSVVLGYKLKEAVRMMQKYTTKNDQTPWISIPASSCPRFAFSSSESILIDPALPENKEISIMIQIDGKFFSPSFPIQKSNSVLDTLIVNFVYAGDDILELTWQTKYVVAGAAPEKIGVKFKWQARPEEDLKFGMAILTLLPFAVYGFFFTNLAINYSSHIAVSWKDLVSPRPRIVTEPFSSTSSRSKNGATPIAKETKRNQTTNSGKEEEDVMIPQPQKKQGDKTAQPEATTPMLRAARKTAAPLPHSIVQNLDSGLLEEPLPTSNSSLEFEELLLEPTTIGDNNSNIQIEDI